MAADEPTVGQAPKPVDAPAYEPLLGPALVDEPVADEQTNANRGSPWWRLFGVFLLVGFIWFLFNRLDGHAEPSASGQAPAFEVTTFDGEVIRLADLQGQGVVLNFWASWCGPCRAEAELLEELWRQEAGKSVVFVGLNVQDRPESAQAYIEEYDITYPNGPDEQSQWLRSYGVDGIPETFFIDADGNVAGHIRGPVLSEEQFEQYMALIRPIPKSFP